ncbi:hypothetical protein MCELHM10_00378 [Paracoccaceae bacterium]
MSQSPEEIERRLLGDDSISQIIRTYESAFPKPLKNTVYSWMAFTSAALVSVVMWNFGVSSKLLSETLSKLVEVGFALSGVALGLGLAGVAIYASSLKPQTLDLLTRTNYPGTDISALRFILSTFVYVIVAFLRLSLVCFLYYLVASDRSFVLDLISRIFEKPLDAILFAGLAFLPVFFFFFVFAFSNLWSFVLNLHRSILIIAATEVVIISKTKPDSGSR